GDPVTVFAHGLASDITGTRPLGSAVAGRRVFFHFRGHGRSDTPPGPWSFADLAEDLRAVADLSGATRALGASMGAGALCRLLADTPDRFERVVLYLPAPLDGVRPPVAVARLSRLLAAVGSGGAGGGAGGGPRWGSPGFRGCWPPWSPARRPRWRRRSRGSCRRRFVTRRPAGVT